MSEYVNPDDLKVKRDEHGDVTPITTTAGDFGKVDVIPMTYGKVQAKFGDGQQFDFDSSDIAEIVNDHVIRPDLTAHAHGEGYEGVDENYIEDMYPLAPRDLLMAILDASGVEADVEATGQGGAQVQVPGN